MAQSKFDLSGRVILITGAGGGIGRATARELARLGATLFVTDLDARRAEDAAADAKTLGAEVQMMAHDVSRNADWDTVIEQVGARWRRLDGLVNNAGFMLTVTFLTTFSDDFRCSMEVNAISVFEGTRRAAQQMIETAETFGVKPSIVNVSSIYGQIAGPAHVGYSASKGAVRAMTKGSSWREREYE